MENLTFVNITNYREPLQTELLEYSAIEYLKWCFAKIGGFSSTKYNASNGLDLLKVPASGNKAISLKSQWIYESGLSGILSPINISGVLKNGSLMTSGYTINYNDGEITFDSPVLPSDVIRVEYSYRTPQIHKRNEWFKQLQFDSTTSNITFGSTSGFYNILAKNRVQLPAIVVHVPTETPRNLRPYGMGTITNNHAQNTEFYIITANDEDNSRIHDILVNQKTSSFNMLDKRDIFKDGKSQLNDNGSLNLSGFMYPSLELTYGIQKQRVDVKNAFSDYLISMPNFNLTRVVWNTEFLVN